MAELDRVRLKQEDRAAAVDERVADDRIRVRHEPDEDQRTVLEIPEAYNLRRDRLRWGPIMSGIFTTLTTLIILGVLGTAVGFTSASGAGAAGATPNVGTSTAIWGAIAAIVAFFLGGYVAGSSAAVFDRKWGAWNGAMVFLVTIPIALAFTALGAGAALGSAGQLLGATGLSLNQVTPNVSAPSAGAVSSAAWWTLIALLVGLAAAAIGGMVGTRRTVDLDRALGDVERR